MEEITARLILHRRHRFVFRERSGRASENLDIRPRVLPADGTPTDCLKQMPYGNVMHSGISAFAFLLERPLRASTPIQFSPLSISQSHIVIHSQ